MVVLTTFIVNDGSRLFLKEIYYSSPMSTFRLWGGIPHMPSTLYGARLAENMPS